MRQQISQLWRKPLQIANEELMFNKHLMQYQIFIKNPLTKSALQKISLHVMLKWKVYLKLWTSQ